MLTGLSLKNFKTWENAELTFGKITGLFGTNSSGKSSLIQFLLMLKQTKDATDRAVVLELNDQLVSLGTFRDVIFRHEEDRSLEWQVRFGFDDALSLVTPGERSLVQVTSGQELSFSAEVGRRGKLGDAATKRMEYSLGGVRFGLSEKDNGEGYQLHTEGGAFQFVRNPGRVWQLPGPVKSYAFPDQVRTYYQNASFLADIERAFEDQFDHTYYLGPLREYPQRDYLWSRNRPTDVGKKGEKSVDAILAMTASQEKRNVRYKSRLIPFQEIVAYWLKEIGVIHDFSVVEIAEGSNRWQAKVIARPGGAEAMLTDVGFGVSQVLPVVTLLQYVPPGSTVILEQPEIHLHPLAQANLADAIINAAVHRNVQVVLESHSEHLLLRLQRRIAEGEMDAEAVRLFFCSAKADRSQVEPLRLDLLGNIENWPENFMGDAFGETVAAERARLTRKVK